MNAAPNHGAGASSPPPGATEHLAASLLRAALDPGPGGSEGAPAEHVPLPRRFGAYELLEEIGRGGMGVVYRSRQTNLDRIVAVKLLIAGPYSSEAMLRRFQLEATAAAAQQHPGIVAVHDCGEVDGQPFIAMDFIRGKSLAEIAAGQPLEARRAARIMAQIATALHAAHGQGILHRDLKPSNVLLDGIDAPHITDFGLAARLDGDNAVTLTGQMLGSPSYTSPEQAAGRHDLTGVASDIYGLGALFYHLLTGRPPFAGSTPTDTLRLVLDSEPVPPRVLNQALPGELATICLKCLNKEPSGRYATAAELADDLTRFLADQPIRAQPPGAVYRLRKFIRRHQLACGAVAATGVALALGTAVSTWQAIRATRAEQRESHLRLNEAAMRRLAEEQTMAIRRQAYASDLNLVQQALAKDDLTRAQQLLNRHRPQPGEQDLRGWEWRYLWQFCRSDPTLVLNDGPVLARELAISPDGAWLATAVYDEGAVELWNLRSRDHYPVPLPPGLPCVAIAFSPTQPLLAIHYPLGRDILPGPARIMLWDYAARLKVGEWTLEHRGMRRGSLAFSADGSKLLVAVGSDPTIRSVPRGELLQSLHKGDGDKMAIAPGFDRVAIEGPAGSVRLLDLAQGTYHEIAGAAKEYVSAYAFSPDGTILATAGGGTESTIRLWDPATGGPVGVLEGHHLPVGKLVFWPDGRTLASASFDRTIRVWDVASRQARRTLRGLQGELCDLVLAPDGTKLVSASRDRLVRMWDATGTPRPAPSHVLPAPVLAWTFARDSRTLITVDAEGQVSRWSGSGFEAHAKIDVAGLAPVVFRRWNPPLPQGAFLTADPDVGVTLTPDRTLLVWNWDRRTLERTIPTAGHREQAVAVVGLSAGNHRVLVNWIDPERRSRGLAEWDLATGKLIRSWPYAHAGSANFPQSQLSPDGRLCLVSWCENPFWESAQNWGAALLVNLDSGLVRQVDGAAPWWWKSPAFSADSRRLAIPHPRGATMVVEGPSFQMVKSLPSAGCASFSPDGGRLALLTSEGMSPLRLFDTTSWETVLSLEVPQGFLFSAGFSPDGNVLALWSQFNRLVLWSAPSWADIAAAEGAAHDPRAPQSAPEPPTR